MRKTQIACLFISVVIFSAALPAPAGTNVAVFNFQMTSETPEWVWLEKFLSDQITTDFAQSRTFSVVARDEMQLLAQKLNWAPEMATTDPKRMADIRRQLKIKYLISGICSIKDGRLEITAQVVYVKDRKELYRKKMVGKTDEVLELQRRLSAELLSWFTKRPAGQILTELPVWTRSIPAARALYEGMHLYDQGRYGEAWLKFRQASRKDPAYIEAQYWVGKMYYFMDRYLHARRAFEKFVYMDSTHPRVGDAVKEFIHTYEKLDTQPEVLLRLYGDLIRRYPDVLIYGEMGTARPVSNKLWLNLRSAKLLGQIDRYEEAIPLALEVHQKLRDAQLRDTLAWRVAMQNIIAHNMQTGKVVFPKSMRHVWWDCREGPNLIFEPGQNEVIAHLKHPQSTRGLRRKDGRRQWVGLARMFNIAAPDGYAFRKLRLYPLMRGHDGTVRLRLQIQVWSDAGMSKIIPLAEAKEKGILFDRLPRSGLLSVKLRFYPKDKWRNPGVYLEGLRAVAEMEKIGSCGMIDVACVNASQFKVDIDGRLGRTYKGRIGLVPPGEHTLRFYGMTPGAEYGEWTTKVIVKPGKVTRVMGRLPWRKGSPWASWNTVLVGRDYPSNFLSLQKTLNVPCVQVDDEAIRLVWSWAGDIWSSISTDGNEFSRPRRLGLPVSSGWIEEYPRCIRDESGRFLLIFQSDRNALRRKGVYVCWSRDFVHWSAPVMVLDREVWYYDIVQDQRGNFILADIDRPKKKADTGPDRFKYVQRLTIQTSRDAYIWKEVATWPPKEVPQDIELIFREDGRYELITTTTSWEKSRHSGYELEIWRYMSNDLKRWSKPELVAQLPYSQSKRLAALRSNGRTILLVTGWAFQLIRETGDGAWQSSKRTYGPAANDGEIAYHPKWGYVVVWIDKPWIHRLNPGSGPYLIRGRSIEQFFPQKGKSAGPATGKAEASSSSKKDEEK